jgi:hypothetical protein
VVKTVQMWEKRMDGGKHSTEKIKIVMKGVNTGHSIHHKRQKQLKF